MRNALSLVVVATLTHLAGADATHAGARALTVEVEVAPSGAPPLTFALQLAEDQGCANVSSHQTERDYDVAVCTQPSDGDANPLLRLDVSSTERNGRATTQRHFKLAARVPPGKKTALGKLAAPDGSSIVLSATARWL